jgi:hypothetical protein
MSRISTVELNALAAEHGFSIQHDCGGYRVVDDGGRYLFPANGICPTATRSECRDFLAGYKAGAVMIAKIVAAMPP